jgi:4-hydroxy-tetrahydrodipicolinate synthase
MALSKAKEFAFETVRGLWVAIPTPFTAAGQLDEPALRASVEHYIEALNVDGIYCGGVMGEFWSMSVPERRRVHELVADTAAGRVPLIAQTSHHVFEECIALTDHATELGIELAIVMNPYFPPRPSDDLVRAWYHGLAARTGQPTFLFNTAYSGYALSPELISELADIDIICGIKNPKPHDHLMKVHDLCSDRIVVCDAAEDDWLDLHLNHGFQALMSTPALALFQTASDQPVARYTALADEGRLDEAWELHATLQPHRRAFQRWMRDPWLTNLAGAVPIAELKAWLGLMGLPQGPVRLPLVPLNEKQLADLTADLDAMGLLAAPG